MKKLFLIDGHALIFRMYYAFLRRPMINSKGQDTSILFGFTKYLLEIIQKEQPSHIAVMFDPPAKTFRHEMDPEYKATRSATPELVKEALEPLKEIVSALRIPVLMKSGFEADDVIGTIAKRFASPDFEVYMVTPDKDLGQIIDEHIYQYKPGKAGADKEIVSKDSLCEAFGISNPSQIIDILAIWGDAADNVKGVNGIGEVGARRLVGKYGSIEAIEQHISELPAKQQAAFREALPHLPLSKALVTIKTDVDIETSEDDLRIEDPDIAKISELFNKYEFNSLRNLLPMGAQIEEEPQVKELECRQISKDAIFDKARKEGAIAVKFTATDVILASGSDYCRLRESEASPILSDPLIKKVGHSFKTTILKGEIYDIEIMHYLLNPERSHKLDLLARSYLNIDIEKKEDEASLMLFDFEDNSSPRECAATSLLEPLIRKELEEQGLMELYRKVEMPLIEVLSDMEQTGVKIDRSMLAAYSQSLSKELARIEAEAREMAGEAQLNLSSPKQIGQVLFEKLAIDPKAKKSAKGSYSTDEETLSMLADRHPIVNKILDYRALKKLLSTYIDPLPRMADSASKLHTTFNQALTATGRLSSVQPNLQNIPIRTERGMKIREAFVPSHPEGCIISADYSQIELRLMAHLSGDPAMIEGFAEGADVHRATAARIFGVRNEDVTTEQRRHAKVANFGIIYGISAFGLAQRMGISRTQAKDFIDEYFRNYPVVKKYMDDAIATAHEKGYVSTLMGRKRYLPDINSKNQTVRGLAERNAINAPIQGSAADIIKLAMIAVYKRFEKEGVQSKMVLQVHDELVFDVLPGERDKVMEIVREEMENIYPLSVPLIVECNYGRNWREAH